MRAGSTLLRLFDGRVELRGLLEVHQADASLLAPMLGDQILHRSDPVQRHAPRLEGELGFRVDRRGSRGHAAVQSGGADGSCDRVEVRHEVAAKDGALELGHVQLDRLCRRQHLRAIPAGSGSSMSGLAGVVYIRISRPRTRRIQCREGWSKGGGTGASAGPRALTSISLRAVDHSLLTASSTGVSSRAA